MAYLTFNDLSSRTFSRASNLNESIKTRSYSDVNVFLSYRREDRIWVDGIVRFLKGLGVNVYVDYLDQTLEDLENDQVAKTLRDAINKCKKFISLATPNSSKSKWMAWELGLGDQEYGKIYGRIENINSYGFNRNDNWYVIYPNSDRVALKQWLLN